MNKLFIIMASLVLLVHSAIGNTGPQWVPGEMIIKLKTTANNLPRQGKVFQLATLDKLVSTSGLIEYRRILPKEEPRLPNITRMFLLKFPKEADVLELCRQYSANPDVEYSEPNYIGGLCSAPDDPFWSLQWGMFGDRLNLPAAWNIANGSSDVIVAIIDNGIDTLHPDLRAALWMNPGEIPDNGIDDDDNGYVDDVRGWNFNEQNNNVFYNPSDAGHGTACAGIIGAVTNNSEGVAGIAGGWGASKGCKLMPLRSYIKVTPQLVQFIESVGYAANNGAKVISMSIHFPVDGFLQSVQDAVNDAYNNGCILVAASGNGGFGTVEYPGACDNVIAVGATIQDDTRWNNSNYGPELDVVAPGGDNPPLGFTNGNIYTTTTRSDGSYTYFSGTSAACPHVAGLAALLFSANPNLTNVQVERIIKWTADTVDYIDHQYGPDHWNEYYGFGRINAFKAVLAATNAAVPAAPTGLAVASVGINTVTLTWNKNTEPNLAGYRLYYGNSPGTYATSINIDGNDVSSYTLAIEMPGEYYFALKAYNFIDNLSANYSNEVYAMAGIAITAQNQFIDAGNVNNVGTVAIDGVNYSSPYFAYNFANTYFSIGATSEYFYNNATQYFCSMSDGGTPTHTVAPSTSTTYTAFYKKRPSLTGTYDGWTLLLNWDWPLSSRPLFFNRFELYQGGVGEIWEGTVNSKYLKVALPYKTFYGICAVMQSGPGELRVWSNDISIYASPLGDPIVSYSTTQEATSYSNGKKLVIDNTGKLHVVFASNDTVYYTTSTDEGNTWSIQTAVGEGKNPAIELNSSQAPSVCWSKANELYYTEHSSDVWGAPQLIYTGPAGSEVSYLSYVLDQKTNNSYLGWVDEGATASAVYISPYTPGGAGQLAPTPIDQGGAGSFKSPSLALDRSGNLKATWSNNGRVYYFDETGQLELGENGIHPIVDTYGDKTSVVWQEEIAPGVYQIAKRNKGPLGWGEKQVISYPDSKNADFPVVAANGQYVYSKNTNGGDYDIQWHGEYDNGWVQYERNISSASGGISKYPSVAFRQLWPKSQLYILWTEDLPDAKAAIPAKPVKIYAQEVDPVPYFYADLGTEEAAVYTMQKQGSLYYGQKPDLTVDYHPTQLKYTFTGLDSTKRYMLKAVYYHESKGRIQQKMKIDGQQFDVANLKPKEKGEFKRWLTPNLYQDGQIDITIDKQKGEYAVCAVLSIEEYEKDCDQTKGGGTQLETSAVALPTTFSLLQNAPNPMAGFTAINFAVAKPGNVSLKIYNISGQLVKTLVNEGKQPGYYNVRWDGKDESGQQAAAGVYFYRIQANEFNNTKKLVVLR